MLSMWTSKVLQMSLGGTIRQLRELSLARAFSCCRVVQGKLSLQRVSMTERLS